MYIMYRPHQQHEPKFYNSDCSNQIRYHVLCLVHSIYHPKLLERVEFAPAIKCITQRAVISILICQTSDRFFILCFISNTSHTIIQRLEFLEVRRLKT